MIVPCPNCQRKLTIDDALAGQRGVCPACHQPFDIPHAPSEVGAAKSPPPPPPASKSPPPMPPMPGAAEPPGTKTAKAGGAAPVPPALPKTPPTRQPVGTATAGFSSADADAAIGQALAALGKSFSVRKLSFFLIGGTAIAIVVLLMMWVNTKIVSGAKETSDLSAAFAWLLLTGVVVAGLAGVVTGGVAYLTARESQGVAVRLADVFRFCRRRFLVLFVSLLLLMVALGLALGIANGLVWLIYKLPSVGKPIAALL